MSSTTMVSPGATKAFSESPKRTAGGNRGEFFAIDRCTWREVCSLGLNAAVAFLVLARFTGRLQRHTKAGTKAVEKYTGLSRSRARKAIGDLVRGGRITEAEGVSSRRILLPHEATSKPTITVRQRGVCDQKRAAAGWQ